MRVTDNVVKMFAQFDVPSKPCILTAKSQISHLSIPDVTQKKRYSPHESNSKSVDKFFSPPERNLLRLPLPLLLRGYNLFLPWRLAPHKHWAKTRQRGTLDCSATVAHLFFYGSEMRSVDVRNNQYRTV